VRLRFGRGNLKSGPVYGHIRTLLYLTGIETYATAWRRSLETIMNQKKKKTPSDI
jgi:hypothetical protein